MWGIIIPLFIFIVLFIGAFIENGLFYNPLFILLLLGVLALAILDAIKFITDNIRFNKQKNIDETLASERKKLEEEFERKNKKIESEKEFLYATVSEELTKTENERKRLINKRKDIDRYCDNLNSSSTLPQPVTNVENVVGTMTDDCFSDDPYGFELEFNQKIWIEEFEANTKDLWHINSLFFYDITAMEYKKAFKDVITKRAIEEHFVFEDLSFQRTNLPYQVSAFVISLKDNGEQHKYITSLTGCNCTYFMTLPKYDNRAKVCKHMMALALKVGAVRVDVYDVLNRY